MEEDWEFDLQDCPKENLRTDYKDFFRVYVAPGGLKARRLQKNDCCNLNISGKTVGTVLVWELNKISKPRELQISKRLQFLYGVTQGTKVKLSRINEPIPGASHVTLHEVASDGTKAAHPKLRDEEFLYWAWLLKDYLYRAEYVSPGMILDGIETKFQRRSFIISYVNSSSGIAPHRFEQSCQVKVISGKALGSIDPLSLDDRHLTIPKDHVGGLEDQLKKLSKLIASFAVIKARQPMQSSLPKWWRNGIILHGPSGTGKTLLLRSIARAGWRRIFDLSAELSKYPALGEKALAAMKDVFADAKDWQPSIILLDELETFAGYDSTHSSVQGTVLINTLRQELNGLGSFRSLVVATTRSMANVSPKLRSAHGFSHEMEIPVPSSRSRALILKALCNLPPDATDALLEDIASRTHGFVGADLEMLLVEATGEDGYVASTIDDVEYLTFSRKHIKEENLEFALREVKPTAIREVFVEIPDTRWDDIGGHGDVKNILHQALILPSQHAEDFKAQALTPSKGLLLYGPPGCSKTMIARAAATETHFSFIAVKGAELLNMYVGESERKVREVFSRARTASPSILFFDEIDAIGTSRGDGQHAGLNIVTTLLNELDGIDTLKDVFVLAATNRPDIIDSALTRAGRLDRMLYVGPPDLDARRSILTKRLRKMTIEEDLDIESLTEETEGYSGAELIKICNDAGLAAIKELRSTCSDGTSETSVTRRRHFDMALSDAQKTIDSDMLEFFESFRKKHRSQHITK